MTHYDDETLAGVALGDDADPVLWAHLQVCPECSATLATLRRTVARVNSSAEQEFAVPPAHVWEQIEAQTAPAADADPAASKRRPGLWMALALAAGIAIGAVGSTVAGNLRGADSAPVTAWSAQLATAKNRTVGTAVVVRTETGLDLKLDTGAVGEGPGYLEVWLINKDKTRTVSIGILSPKRTTQTFVISQALLDEGYVVVDVSREPFDTKPAHSGDTLFRGTLTA